MSSPEAILKDNELRLRVVRAGLWRCCMNCEHWCEVSVVTSTERVYNHCGKYNMLPPDDILLVGCVEHVQEIPF